MTSAGDGGGCISNTSPWRVPTAAQASLASGGAIVVTFEGGEVIALESSFSEPGPTDYSLNTEVDVGWTSLVVNRSGTARGVLGHVLATRPEWTLRRTVVWPHNSHALLVDDTLTALGGEVVGTWVTHSAVFLPSAGRPAAAILPGLSNGYQCDASYYETPGDLYTNNGRPDVFANSSKGVAVGVTALDDVFRAHAMAQNRFGTFGSIPRPSLWDMPPQPCPLSTPPSVALADPHLALAPGQPYTMEWAAFPSDNGCADYWCYVNRLREFLGNQGTITLAGTGFLPFVSTNTSCAGTACTNTTYRGEPEEFAEYGYTGPGWETWSAGEMRAFFDHQGIDYVVADNGGWGGECHCGATDCLNDVDGAQFVNSMPKMMQNYIGELVHQVHVGGRKAMMYIATTLLSSAPTDRTIYSDSAVTAKDGQQVSYVECETPHGKPLNPLVEGSTIGDLPVFVGNLSNAYGQMLLSYVRKVFAMGFDGLYHDEFGGAAVFYTYHQWDSHSALLDPKTKRILALVGSLQLLGAEIELAILEQVASHNAEMLVNGAPTTREWMRRARGRVTHFVENGAAFHGHFPQLFTPIQLNRYGGNQRDPDPKYDPNCTAASCDTRKITDVLTNVLMHLDHGLLSFGYDGLFEKDPRQT